MDLILLAGNSIDNKEWIEEVESAFKPFFSLTQIQYYDHWQSGKELIDLNKEIKKLTETTKSKKQYVIFAKSAGSLVTLKAIFEKKISPHKCIFIGIPINWAKKYGFDIKKWFKDFDLPSLIIQHTNDPIASIQELSKFLKKETVANCKLVELSGNDHYYSEIDKIKDLTTNFI